MKLLELADVEIRPATPDQSERAAELLYTTARPIFDFLYGPDPVLRSHIFARQWEAPESMFSHSHALGAYGPDGTLVGIELGFDNGAEEATFAGTYAVLRDHTTKAQQAEIGAAGRQLTYLKTFMPPGNYYVSNLAVREIDKVPGLGRLLLEGAFERAKGEGYKTVCLDVIDTNPAIGFYLHLGMHLACETRVPDLIEQHGLPSIYRMVMDL